MAHYSKKKLAEVAATVTGIGWATPAQAACYLSMGYSAILDAIRAGEIRHSRVGRSVRIKYSELDAFMEARECRVQQELMEFVP